MNKQLTLGEFLHNLTVIFRDAYTHSFASYFIIPFPLLLLLLLLMLRLQQLLLLLLPMDTVATAGCAIAAGCAITVYA